MLKYARFSSSWTPKMIHFHRCTSYCTFKSGNWGPFYTTSDKYLRGWTKWWKCIHCAYIEQPLTSYVSWISDAYEPKMTFACWGGNLNENNYRRMPNCLRCAKFGKIYSACFYCLQDSGVGKSSLVLRFVSDRFDPKSNATIG